ncbi:ADP-ribosylhydrolase ARH1-like [Mycteria americana]|uniref:ADP-ribosylhydrolase ARH1-like n=1 Tax=Mycteria americana TaxID=33587 RepID=UPI003F58275A
MATAESAAHCDMVMSDLLPKKALDSINDALDLQNQTFGLKNDTLGLSNESLNIKSLNLAAYIIKALDPQMEALGPKTEALGPPNEGLDTQDVAWTLQMPGWILKMPGLTPADQELIAPGSLELPTTTPGQPAALAPTSAEPQLEQRLLFLRPTWPPGSPVPQDYSSWHATGCSFLLTDPAGNGGCGLEGEPLLQELARCYMATMGDMEGRKPGPTSILGISQLRPREPEGYRIPFKPTGTGCGAAMRSLAIGLRYPHTRELLTLIRVSRRMTHHPPTGYLGVLAVALFGALGARGEPPERWGAELLWVLPLAWDYVEGTEVAAGDNAATWPFFGDAWHRYLESRGLLEGRGPPQVPSLPSPAERDAVYLGWALEGWPGRSGHDAPMVALEALLAAGRCWGDLCARGVLHGGDSDSTGTIATGCWGLRGGLAPVPPGLHCCLEYCGRLRDAAHRLHALAWERS